MAKINNNSIIFSMKMIIQKNYSFVVKQRVELFSVMDTTKKKISKKITFTNLVE